MAALINAVADGHDHDHDPLTVHGDWTGIDLELGFFSRLREVHPHHGMDH
jgi:predicted DNA-binding ribbon-helix-helix protein